MLPPARASGGAPGEGQHLGSREDADREVERFFEEHWRKDDAWGLDRSPWERTRLDRLRDVIADRRYERALEIGCGAGHFTERLLPLASAVLALDVAPAAIEKARARLADPSAAPATVPPMGHPAPAAQRTTKGRVELRVANVMHADLRAEEGPFDLVVLTETVYYLGWLYPFFAVAWLARDLFAATRPGGRLLLANTLGDIGDALVLSGIVRSYHDVFKNAGYETEREETQRGTKDGVDLEVLISLLRRPAVTD
jgi:SAM-dependent methyltransferase